MYSSSTVSCLESSSFPFFKFPGWASVRYRALSRTPTKTQIWLARCGRVCVRAEGAEGKGTEDFSVSLVLFLADFSLVISQAIV